MTVGELIEILKEFPASSPVLARVCAIDDEDDEEHEVRIDPKPYIYCGEVVLEP